MSQRMELRQGRLWVAGAGWAILGASTLFSNGCTTTVADLKAGSKSNQVASKTGKAPAAKSNKQVASKNAAKNAPGKTRLSDLDDESRDRMIAQVAARSAAAKAASAVPQQGPASAMPSETASRPPAAEIAAAPSSAPAATDSSVAASSQASAAAMRRVAARSAPRSKVANTVVADARTSSGITQTAGAARSSGGSSPRTAKTANRPQINPKKTQWQPENGGDTTIASKSERARADLLMKRAHAMLDAGFREEALRLASIAADLEKSQQAIYRRSEERPSQFIAQLQREGRIGSSPEMPSASNVLAGDSRTESQLGSISAKRSLLDASGRNAARPSSMELRTAVEPSGSSITAGDSSGSAAAQPRFATDDRDNLRAAANAGQLEVPLPPLPRNPNVGTLSAELEMAALRGKLPGTASSGVVTADRLEEAPEPQPSPKKLVMAAKAQPAPVASSADVALPDEEIEPITDSDSSGSSSSASSRLTIASLAGLLAGIAGMLGLGWWRRQEQRHYAAAKKRPDLRIQETEEEPAPVRRAA